MTSHPRPGSGHAPGSRPEEPIGVGPDTDDVLVVGAGPTGLMVAHELALAGVRCRVLERRREESNLTRAFGLHARALELLDGRGLADEIVDRGVRIQRLRPVWGPEIDLSDLDSRFPMLLVVPQSGTERVLERRGAELGVEVVRGAEVATLDQGPDAVRLGLTGGGEARASYVVAADGAHSTVRGLLGSRFVGERYTTPMLLADVRMPGLADTQLVDHAGRDGAVLAIAFGDGWYRVGAWLRTSDASDDHPPDVAELRTAFQRIAGDDFGMGEPRWISRFVSESRQVRDYRAGRVFLAGDAAHTHSPMGGQGMNTGLQDALNLGWKLGAAVHGWAPPWLLDSYQRERHPVGADVLRMTERLTHSVVNSSRTRRWALTAAIRTALGFGPTRRRFLDRLSGVGIRYPPRPGTHRLEGGRATDWTTDQGRLYELLRQGRFVLLDAGGDGGRAVQPWRDRVRVAPLDAWPGAPRAVLVRPDGYVAWAHEHPDPDTIRSALAHWCGPAPSTVGADPRR